MAEFAARHGVGLDDHQKLILETFSGVDEDGRWVSFSNAIVEPRQNGKSHSLIVRALYGAFVLGEPLVMYSAHQWATANEIFLTMLEIVENSDELSGQVRKKQHSAVVMGFVLKNGSRIRFLTRSRSTARGFTGQCLILDEAHFLSEAAHGTLLPTLRAKTGGEGHARPQVLYASSAVDQTRHPDGMVMSVIREHGKSGDRPGLAYLEWSAAILDDAGEEVKPDQLLPDQLMNREYWRQATPACPERISEDHIAIEAATLDQRSFAVELMGVGDWFDPALAGSQIIDLEEWADLEDRTSRLLDPACIALDLSPERRASISAAGLNEQGMWHVESILTNARPKHAVARAVEIVDANEPAMFVVDGYGPAASVVHQLEEAGIKVDTVTASELGQACGVFVDAVTEANLRHLGSAELTNAIRGAGSRPLGDAWAWSRKNSSVDISPLVSSTLALWAAMQQPATGEVRIM